MAFIDGGSRGNPGISGCGYYDSVTKIGWYKYLGKMTNNEAEYNGLLLALEKCKDANMIIHSDSKLVVNHVNGIYQCKSENLIPLYKKVMAEKHRFQIKHVLRDKNKFADRLVNKAMDDQKSGSMKME